MVEMHVVFATWQNFVSAYFQTSIKYLQWQNPLDRNPVIYLGYFI